jgi:hypothetical protein
MFALQGCVTELVDAAPLDGRLINCLALLVMCSKLAGSSPLLRLGRAAFVFWEERLGEDGH